MTKLFDDSRIELSCPGCGHKFRERIGKLKMSPKIPCSGCGAEIAIDAKGLNSGIQQAEKTIADFDRSLRKIFK